jgi:hypothetical protein
MLPPNETTVHHNIPVTTPARTILDLAATLSERALERTLDQAEIQRLTDYPPSMPWHERTPATAERAISERTSKATAPAPR